MRCKYCKEPIEYRVDFWWHPERQTRYCSREKDPIPWTKAAPDIFHHYYTQIHIK